MYLFRSSGAISTFLPFKKSSIVDTVINVGVGGAANVAMDYAVENIDFLKSLGDTTVNIIKIGVGALAGSMVSNRYARAAADGLATVGASDLIKSYITTAPASGVPFMGTGRTRTGQKNFRIVKPARGTGRVPFMS